MSVSIFHMHDRHGSQAVSMCKEHARQAFPCGLKGGPHPVELEPCDDDVDCEFCPEEGKEDEHKKD